MPEEVLFKDERDKQRDEVANYLRTVADKLDSGGQLSLDTGNDSITVDVPDRVEFEVKVEREGPDGGPKEIGFELEMEWPEGAAEGDGDTDTGLSIS